MQATMVFIILLFAGFCESYATDVNSLARIGMEQDTSDLVGLLGRRLADDCVREFVDGLGRTDARYRFAGSEYLEYYSKGITLQFDSLGTLVSIRIRGAAVPGIIFRPYAGKVPFGLSVLDRKSTIERDLGHADATGILPKQRSWAQFRSMGLQFVFSAHSNTESDPGIEEIVVTIPRK